MMTIIGNSCTRYIYILKTCYMVFSKVFPIFTKLLTNIIYQFNMRAREEAATIHGHLMIDSETNNT